MHSSIQTYQLIHLLASQPLAKTEVPVVAADTSSISALPAQATTQRMVTFASPFGNTSKPRRHHQEDPFNPFIMHTEVRSFVCLNYIFIYF